MLSGINMLIKLHLEFDDLILKSFSWPLWEILLEGIRNPKGGESFPSNLMKIYFTQPLTNLENVATFYQYIQNCKEKYPSPPLCSWKVSLKILCLLESVTHGSQLPWFVFYLYQKGDSSYIGDLIFGSTHIGHFHQRAKHLVSEEQLNTAKFMRNIRKFSSSCIHWWFYNMF